MTMASIQCKSSNYDNCVSGEVMRIWHPTIVSDHMISKVQIEIIIVIKFGIG